MWENLKIAFLIMGKGMAGIFVAILLLTLAVVIMSKLLGKKS